MLRIFALPAAVAAGFLAASPAAAQRIQPAPAGDPVQVAADALGQAKTSCGKVTRARRLKDGVIDARCASGQRFLVFTLKGETMTKMCTPAQALGIHGC